MYLGPRQATRRPRQGQGEDNNTNFLWSSKKLLVPSLAYSPSSHHRAPSTTVLQMSQEATTNDDDDEDSSSENQENGGLGFLPSYRTLLVFIVTTTLIYISEPLLSLVDTTIVGRMQSSSLQSSGGGVADSVVVQVAALGPATTLIDSLQYMTYFLAMATTSLVAKYLTLQDYYQLQQTTSQTLGIAGMFGLLITFLIYGAGYPIFRLMIGAGAANIAQQQQLIRYATRYCYIRGLVSPLAVMGLVAESNCLANMDTTTPTVAVIVASIAQPTTLRENRSRMMTKNNHPSPVGM